MGGALVPDRTISPDGDVTRLQHVLGLHQTRLLDEGRHAGEDLGTLQHGEREAPANEREVDRLIVDVGGAETSSGRRSPYTIVLSSARGPCFGGP